MGRVPLSYMLCRAAFSDAYVAKILAVTPPEWRVIQTWAPVSPTSLQPNVLLLVAGSATQQKTQTLKIRFGGGAAAGAFEIPLGKFRPFLDSLARPN